MCTAREDKCVCWRCESESDSIPNVDKQASSNRSPRPLGRRVVRVRFRPHWNYSDLWSDLHLHHGQASQFLLEDDEALLFSSSFSCDRHWLSVDEFSVELRKRRMIELHVARQQQKTKTKHPIAHLFLSLKNRRYLWKECRSGREMPIP